MTVYAIPITKGKATVDIDSEVIPQEVYEEALKLGLKELANRGMSKLTKPAFKGDEAALAAACMEVAAKNVEKINAGEIKFAGKKAKADGISKEVMTEAMRLAKNLVKDGIKASGKKLSLIKASVITAAAKEYLAADPSLVEQAQINLSERAKVVKVIDIGALVEEDPELVAKAKAKKAKDQLSAKQAGRPKVRAKAKPAQHATH